MPWYRVEDCNRENIERLGGRLHQKVHGRFVTILLHNEQLFCIDSCCYHASGPVGEGPVADIEDIPTIRCMWHNMIFALDTGERVTQEIFLPGEAQGKIHAPVSMSFPLKPQGTAGKVKRSGESVQRVHNVRELDYSDKGIERERWPVEVELEDNEKYPFSVASDKVACNPTYAKMCMTIQQTKIDAPVQQAQEAGEVKNSFARTLLHTLQTSAISGNTNNNNQGDSPQRVRNNGNDFEFVANSSSNSNKSQKQSSPNNNSTTREEDLDDDDDDDDFGSPPRRNSNDNNYGSPLTSGSPNKSNNAEGAETPFQQQQRRLAASASFRLQLEREGLLGTGGMPGGEESGSPTFVSTSRPPGNSRAPTPPPNRE